MEYPIPFDGPEEEDIMDFYRDVDATITFIYENESLNCETLDLSKIDTKRVLITLM